MAGVRIVTDSACDLPQDAGRPPRHRDRAPDASASATRSSSTASSCPPSEFYKRMAPSSEPARRPPRRRPARSRRPSAAWPTRAPTRSCASTFVEAVGHDGQSAQNAAAALEGKVDVRVVDSRSITAGLGTQVIVGRGGRRGRPARPTRSSRSLEDLSGRTRVLGALDTLENLKKGGRIGGAQALLGTLLSIKPLIDISTGVVEEAGKQRTRRKAMLWLRDSLAEAGAVERLAVVPRRRSRRRRVQDRASREKFDLGDTSGCVHRRHDRHPRRPAHPRVCPGSTPCLSRSGAAPGTRPLP